MEIHLKPLIKNKDIRELEKKSNLSFDDLTILQYSKLLETNIQQRCHNIFKDLSFELEVKYGGKVIEFVQMDNGGKMGIRQKIKKKAEGTKAAIQDVVIFCGTPCGQYTKVILVEFKRMGPFKIEPEQQNYHDWFNKIGFSAHITNNPIFFEKVICQEVREFFKEINPFH